MPADPAVQVTLHLFDAFPGVQDQGLVLLELGHDVPLRVDQGLTADVILWHLGEVGLADLDVVAEHVVIADLQASDARPLPLFLLQSCYIPAGLLGLLLQGIQLRGEAFLDYVAVSSLTGGLGRDGRVDEVHNIGQGDQLPLQPGQSGATALMAG